MNEESDRVASHRKGTRRLRTVSVTAAPMAVRVRTTQNYPKSAFAERVLPALPWTPNSFGLPHRLVANMS